MQKNFAEVVQNLHFSITIGASLMLFLSLSSFIAVKIHRSFIHVVLSLLLLVSQQLGLAHVTAHMDSFHNLPMVNAVQRATDAGDVLKAENKPSQALLDLNCDQCFAFSQLATALPVVVPSLPPVLPASFILGVNQDHSICSQIQCAYLSRAPPVPA